MSDPSRGLITMYSFGACVLVTRISDPCNYQNEAYRIELSPCTAHRSLNNDSTFTVTSTLLGDDDTYTKVEPSPTSPGVEPPPIIPEQGPATPIDGTQGGDPYFTPMTVRPEITNRGEVQAALIREYPSNLRDAGIGGTVVVWFYITETGQVQDGRISRSSGQQDFDQAALRVASVFRFTPATNRREPVAVWIEVPITFQVIN